MYAVTVRYPEEVVSYVRRMAKRRHVSDAQIWRDLVVAGIQQSQADDGLLRSVLNVAIQDLCINRRVAGHIDESLIDLTQQDARRALESLE